ncbi:Isovaleryl-CoA dehydrogenase [Penicillium atrosanguineum]|uniref:Isovaleryl-CoA dehydrogenase n=1 Tax=Penicillium atrosanguineum TaxID=1132637 RepID=UPI00239260B3|nr:Isovaleryl-CoA dehydrogenase [Penicillium atrosanguineum]KAJ5304573.1 Isovaleryl-CoA dehydrogenase [Penicillium atrosanguineum]
MEDHTSLEEFPPGTILLEDRDTSQSEVILGPTPSDDPDDPLVNTSSFRRIPKLTKTQNWTPFRKAINFGLACIYVLFTMVLIDINSVAYREYMAELGLTYANFNNAIGANVAGLAVGCLILIPCVHKFGRRPLYLISAIVQFATAIWWAKFHTAGELIAINVIAGLAGSIAEAIVVITIVDMFFIHQHARINGVFIFMQTLGSTGGLIAAGYIVVDLGWRWMWWIIAIMLGVNFLLVLFFFEESKYVPVMVGRSTSTSSDIVENGGKERDHMRKTPCNNLAVATRSHKSYRQRLTFVTKTDIPMIQHFYQPLVVLFTFPAVAFTAISYGAILAWFAACVSSVSYFLIDPPYNFSAAAIGLFNLGGFVGTLIATLTAPFLNDWLIVWLARRNGGIFEPEMRPWMIFPAGVLNSTGLLMFGIGLGRDLAWIILAIGTGLFGFGFVVTADVALTYLTDCYPDILGDALVAVVFVRNGLAMLILFAFTDWVAGMGIQNTFIVIGVLALATLAMSALLMFYGKRARVKTALKYKEFASRQQTQRYV